MASLEYLTQNSLTAYPFKGRTPYSVTRNHPIADDWFYDILFISYTKTIYRVFIFKIEKDATGGLRIFLSNAVTQEPLLYYFDADTEQQVAVPVAFSSEKLVNHYNNTEVSFASFQHELFAIKIIFGPGLIAKGAFQEVYEPAESELCSSAVILRTPDIDNLTFESYEAREENNPLGFVVNFTPESILPVVHPKANTYFKQIAENSGELYVMRNAGSGLYDNCPTQVDDVFLINSIPPTDPEGAMFLKTSACHAINALTENDELLFGDLLDKYKTFTIHLKNGGTALFDAVSPAHSLTFQNFCKPKCPPENLSAFAHYMNRVADGATELAQSVHRNTETRGKGVATLNSFSATQFCDQNSPFVRCVSPETDDEYIDCGNSFLKYFHEGRTLQIYYDEITTRSYKIIEVVDADTVILDTVPPPPVVGTSLHFRVLDNGVISNLNCATREYNLTAASFTKPYFKVKHTTAESYDSSGNYNTFVAVVVAVFNPAPAPVEVAVTFSPLNISKQGDFKIRTKQNVIISSDTSTLLPCREYVFVEAVYYLGCEQVGGQLNINVYADGEKVGDTYDILNIEGAPCEGTTAGNSANFTITQTQLAYNFVATIDLDEGVTSITAPSGDVPQGLTVQLVNGNARINWLTNSPPKVSKVYTFYFKASLGPSGGIITTDVTIDYVALPVVVSPLGTTYTSSNRLKISTDFIYTDDNPLLRVYASNMAKVSSNSIDQFTYLLTGALPAGLSFDSTTGAITGQILEFNTLENFSVIVSASNPAGAAQNPQSIYLAVGSILKPFLNFTDPSIEGFSTLIETSNLVEYTSQSPLALITATNEPYIYNLTGQLPAGLLFNSITGKITGRIIASAVGDTVLEITATNKHGESNKLTIILSYAIFSAPTIISPVFGYSRDVNYLSTTTLNSPLLTIEATQALGGTDNLDPAIPVEARNKYSAVGLPGGFSIDESTGKIWGKLNTTELPADLNSPFSLPYTVRLFAKNPVGEAAVLIYLTFQKLATPVINNISAGSVRSVVREKVYTSEAPLFTITATNQPTNFISENLPQGLTLTSGGKITGSVLNSLQAGRYLTTFSAVNESGTSAPISMYWNVPINIVTPVENSIITIVEGEANNNIFEVTTCGLLSQEDVVSITISELPAGLTFSSGKLQGTPTVSGFFKINITAQTNYSSQQTISVNIAVTSVFTLSGKISGTIPAGTEVKITDGNQLSQYVTIVNNLFSKRLPAGVYIVTPNPQDRPSYTPGYSYTPITRTVNLTTSRSDAVFTATIPRDVSGLILAAPILGNSGIDLPIAGVSVYLVGKTALSQADGSYIFTNINPGRYAVSVYSADYAFNPSSKTITLDNQHLTGVTFNPVQYTISGKISYGSIANFKNIVVSLKNSNNQIVRSVSSNDNNYELFAPRGAYKIYPQAQGLSFSPEYIDISVGAANEADNNFVITITANVVPEKVSTVTAVGGNKTLNISHSVAVVPNSGPNIGIAYDYSLDNGQTWNDPAYTFININPTTVQAAGLANSTEYQVKVRAKNIAGTGEASDAVSGVTKGVPTSPTITSIQPSSGKLRVYFSPPAYDGGYPVIRYYYSINDASYSVANNITSSYLDIAGLANGTICQVKIKAENVVGPSPASNMIEVQVCTTPEPPQISLITEGNKQLTVTFIPPSITGGAAVSSYRYAIGSQPPQNVSLATATTFLITGLTNGQAYSIKMQAANQAGYSDFSNSVSQTPISVPEITIVEITPQNSKLKVLFNIVDTGGLPLLGIKYSVNSANYVNVPSADLVVEESYFKISNLTNGTPYSIKIVATNRLGDSLESEAVIASPAPAVPSSPILLNLTPTNQMLTADVSTVDDGGSPILDFLYSLNGGEFVSAGSSVEPFNISGLNNGEIYTVAVKVVNVVGSSVSSNTLSATPRTVSGKPVIDSVVAGDKQLTVNFTPPASNGGAVITGYKYSLNNQNYVNVLSINSPIVITNLINGTEYTVRLKAVNIAGDSIDSDPLSATPGKIPGAPEITSITPGDGVLHIHFNVPDDGGRDVAELFYSINEDEFESVEFTQESTPNFFSADLLGLANGVNYNVRIKITTALGESPVSNLVSASPYTVPSVITINSIEAGNQAMWVDLTPGFDGGSPITGFYVKDILGNKVALAPYDGKYRLYSSEYYALENDAEYRFYFYAQNAAGEGESVLFPDVIIFNPSIPEPPIVESIEESSGRVKFYLSVPNNGGYAITDIGYSIDGGEFVFVGNANVDPFIISNLTNFVTYDVRIKLYNAEAGAGRPTEVIQVTPKLYVPDAPTIEAYTVGDQSVYISFLPPIYDGGAPITAYRYTVNSGQSVALESNSFSLFNLNNGTAYTINIYADNLLGSSSPAVVLATPGRPPAAPTILGIDYKPDYSTVRINLPQDTGGFPITQTQLLRNNDVWGGPQWENIWPNPTSVENVLEFNIPFGPNDSAAYYTFSLRCLNEKGEGDVVESSKHVFPLNKPDKPGFYSPWYFFRFEVVSNINKQLVLEFATPTDGNWRKYTEEYPELNLNPETEYRLYMVSNRESNYPNPAGYSVISPYALNQLNEAQASLTIGDLYNGTTYYFYLSASTGVGETFSDPLEATVVGPPERAPSIRSIVSNELDRLTISLSFPKYRAANRLLITAVCLNPSNFNIPNVNAEIELDPSQYPENTVGQTAVTIQTQSREEVSNWFGFTYPRLTWQITARLLAVTQTPGCWWCPSETYEGPSTSPQDVQPGAVPGPVDLEESSYYFWTGVDGLAFFLRDTYECVDDGGSPITGLFANIELDDYQVFNELVVKDYITGQPAVGNQNGRWLYVDGLPTGVGIGRLSTYAGNKYGYGQVKTYNLWGQGKATAAGAVLFPIITNTPTENQKISIYFTPPRVSGNITNYEYSIVDNFSTPASILKANKTTSPITKTGLINGTGVTVHLRAVQTRQVNNANVLTSGLSALAIRSGRYYDPSNGPTPFLWMFTCPANTYYIIPEWLVYVPLAQANAPTINSISAVFQDTPKLIVSIKPPTSLGTPNVRLVDYEFSTDNGITFQPCYSNVNLTGATHFATITHTSTTTPETPNALVGGTTYQVKVRALTAATLAQEWFNRTYPAKGVISGVKSVTAKGRPQAPTITSMTAAGVGVYEVSFTPPTNNGGEAITSYEYSLNDAAYTQAVVTPITAAKFNLSGLVRGEEYYITLRALNIHGAGVASAVYYSVPSDIPQKAVIANTQRLDKSIAVVMSTSVPNGGSPILGYKYSLNGGQYQYIASTTGLFTIPNLINGTSYVIQVKSVNFAGDSPPSNPTAELKPGTVPQPPAITSVLVGDGQLTIAYNPPADNGGAEITHYRRLGSSTNYPPYQNPIVVTGLTNGVTYEISLRAANLFGYSAYSSSITRAPGRVPDSPIITSIEGWNKYLKVYFDSNVNNGGHPILNYKYRLNNGPELMEIANDVVSPINITGRAPLGGGGLLTNGQSYSVKIAAQNIFGWSGYSNILEGTPSETPPGTAPAFVIVRKDAALEVSLTPSPDDGGSPITGYKYSLNAGAYVEAVVVENKFTISGLTNGQTYAVRVRAVNIKGDGFESAPKSEYPARIPYAPVVTVQNKNTAVTLIIDSINNGGAEITAYRYKINNGAYVTKNQTTEPINIVSLTNNTEINITLHAVNIVGYGDETVVQAMPGNLSLWAAPTISSINHVLAGTPVRYYKYLKLLIAPPPAMSPLIAPPPITGYAYTLNPDDSAPTYVDFADATWTTEATLDNDTVYKIAVAARNRNGLGAKSNTLSLRTATVPAKHSISSVRVAVGSLGKAVASVVVAPPDPLRTVDPTGGDAIIFYDAYLLIDNSWNKVGNFANSAFTIIDLELATTYTLRVTASNRVGEGEPSNSVNFQTPSLPSAPTIISANPASALTPAVNLFFASGNNNGSAILNYNYSINDAGWSELFPADNSSPCFISRDNSGAAFLENTSYSVKLRAVSAVGESIDSGSFTFTTPSKPTAREIKSISSKQGEITIAINLPAATSTESPTISGGLAITSYQYSLNSNIWHTISLSTAGTLIIPATELTLGNTYSVRIRAVNILGEGVPSEAKNITIYKTPSQSIIRGVSLVFNTNNCSTMNEVLNVGGVNYFYRCAVDVDITVIVTAGQIYSNDTLLYYRIMGFDLTSGNAMGSKIISPEYVNPFIVELKSTNLLPGDVFNTGTAGPAQFDRISKYPAVTAQIYVEAFYRNTSGTIFGVVSPPFNYSMPLYVPTTVYK